MSNVQAATSAPPAQRADHGFARDQAVTALIFGVAAFAWFGWGQAQPPAGWSVPLTVGSVASAVAAVLAGLMLFRLRSGGAAMADPFVRRRYFIIVGAEVLAIVLGVAGLGVSGYGAYLPAWILLIVGIHFLPLARLFGDAGLRVAGIAVIAVAVAAAIAGAASDVPPSAVAGGGGGLVLLVSAVVLLCQTYRASLTSPPPAAGTPGAPAAREGQRGG
ncbi:MAG TPA: hypothetical protein VH641_21365 [Streptosporangiaceae bacterium]|jgi:hypothetical protein